jgi:uncharacterized membrane protein YkoI
MKLQTLALAGALTLAAGRVATAQVSQDTVVKVKAKPELLAQAKVNADSAEAIARSRVTNGKVTSAELEKTKTRLQWEVNVLRAENRGVDKLWIDANKGTVLRVQHTGGPVGRAKRAVQRHKQHEATEDAAKKKPPTSSQS